MLPERTSQSVTHPQISRPSTFNLGVLWRLAFGKEVATYWYEYPINPIKPWAGMSHAASAIMDDADAAAEEFATVLAD